MHALEAAEEAAPSDRGTVLIVEDDDGIRSLLVAVARHDGFDCRIAEDGAGAIEALGDGGAEPDVILLDLLMPRVDGFTVLDHLDRSRPHLLSSVIILTAAGESSLRRRPRKAAGAGRLARPDAALRRRGARARSGPPATRALTRWQ